MRFTDPAGEAIVLDGRDAWVYTPSTTPGQVMKISIASLPEFFNLSRLLTDPSRRFEARGLRQERVNGRPYRRGQPDPEGPQPSLLRSNDLGGPAGRSAPAAAFPGTHRRSVRTLTFSDVRSNERVSAAAFTFVVPDGVRVVDQM
jgi:outer membrane lipoprotein carrier protein